MPDPFEAIIVLTAYAAGIATAVGSTLLRKARRAEGAEPVPVDWMPDTVPLMKPYRTQSPAGAPSAFAPRPKPPRQIHWPISAKDPPPAKPVPPRPPIPAPPVTPPTAMPTINWGQSHEETDT